MERPEKYIDYPRCCVGGHTDKNCTENKIAKAEFEARNKAIDDYEKFLPSKSELDEILKTPNFDVAINDLLRKDIVTAIYNRIHKGGG